MVECDVASRGEVCRSSDIGYARLGDGPTSRYRQIRGRGCSKDYGVGVVHRNIRAAGGDGGEVVGGVSKRDIAARTRSGICEVCNTRYGRWTGLRNGPVSRHGQVVCGDRAQNKCVRSARILPGTKGLNDHITGRGGVDCTCQVHAVGV